MLFINKLFNSIACLLSSTNLQLVIPGRTWILLYSGRTVYKRLWACLALYKDIAQRRYKKNSTTTSMSQARFHNRKQQKDCEHTRWKRSITRTSISGARFLNQKKENGLGQRRWRRNKTGSSI